MVVKVEKSMGNQDVNSGRERTNGDAASRVSTLDLFQVKRGFQLETYS